MTVVETEAIASQRLIKDERTTVIGGEALTSALINGGVDTLFAIPGIQLDGFFNAVWEECDRLRVIKTGTSRTPPARRTLPYAASPDRSAPIDVYTCRERLERVFVAVRAWGARADIRIDYF